MIGWFVFETFGEYAEKYKRKSNEEASSAVWAYSAGQNEKKAFVLMRMVLFYFSLDIRPDVCMI